MTPKKNGQMTRFMGTCMMRWRGYSLHCCKGKTGKDLSLHSAKVLPWNDVPDMHIHFTRFYQQLLKQEQQRTSCWCKIPSVVLETLPILTHALFCLLSDSFFKSLFDMSSFSASLLCIGGRLDLIPTNWARFLHALMGTCTLKNHVNRQSLLSHH